MLEYIERIATMAFMVVVTFGIALIGFAALVKLGIVLFEWLMR
jgi:hypothetical protein